MGTRRKRAWFVLAVAWLVSGLLHAGPARAWYFPEHAELTRLALSDFAPPAVTRTLRGAVHSARSVGLKLCPELTTELQAIPSGDDYAHCVPYAALAALAADHSNSVVDLHDALAKPISRLWPARDVTLGQVLTEAAQNTWIDFLHSAPPDVARVWTADVASVLRGTGKLPRSLAPRDLVRVLDVASQLIDVHYVDRAKDAKTHFHDGTSSMSTVIRRAEIGGLDNALAQLLAHHARSLQLALRSRHESGGQRDRTRTEALLEHAFALHFIEDGLAGGHVVTDRAITIDEQRAQRHDFFNRQGLAVTRAMANRRCEYERPAVTRGPQLPACWTAHGDGFAGAEDRLYVGEAVARLQTAFAIALDPALAQQLASAPASDRCAQWKRDTQPDPGCELAAAASLLDPNPSWLHRKRGPAETWATDVVLGFEAALAGLAREPVLRPANAGTPRAQPGTLSTAVVGKVLSAAQPNGSDEALSWQSTVLMPVLVAWPAAQAEVTSLEGADSFSRGFTVEVVTSLAAASEDPVQEGSSISTWAGGGFGVAYMAQGIFPYRHTRGIVEANVGLGEGLRLAGNAQRLRTVLAAELRIPITLLLFSYLPAYVWNSRVPLDLVGRDFSFGLMGGRLYWSLSTDRATFTGWDVEVINFLLSPTRDARSVSRTGFLDFEGRVRVGARSANPWEPLPRMFSGVFMLSFEVASGYFLSL